MGFLPLSNRLKRYGVACVGLWQLVALVAFACENPEAPLPGQHEVDLITQTVGCDLFGYGTNMWGAAAGSPTDDSNSYGKMTPFWAQEEVGGDLVGALLTGYDAQHANSPSKKVNVGVFDIGGIVPLALPRTRLGPELRACRDHTGPCGAEDGGGHATAVANLIVGVPPIGIGARAQLSTFADGDFPSPPGTTTRGEMMRLSSARFVSEAERLGKLDPVPPVVNMSINYNDPVYATNGGAIQTAMQALSRKTILVHSAGNSFPEPLNRFTYDSPGIVVGSLTPNGLLSDMSQEGPELTITAPSNYELESRMAGKDGRGHFATFHATSGATPLVTAAISNVMSLLPGISLDEVKVLLKNTAIQTSGYKPDNGRNGAGSLNAYKLAQVAIELKDGGWPANRGRLASSPPDASLFDYSDAADILKSAALDHMNKGDCPNMKMAAVKLRRAFFLDPSNTEVRSLLAELYRVHLLYTQAQFVSAPRADKSLGKLQQAQDRLALAIRRGTLNSREAGIDFESIQWPRYRVQTLIAAADTLGARAEPIMISAIKDPFFNVRRVAALHLRDVYGATPRCWKTAMALTHDENAEVREAATQALADCHPDNNLPGPVGAQLKY